MSKDLAATVINAAAEAINGEHLTQEKAAAIWKDIGTAAMKAAKVLEPAPGTGRKPHWPFWPGE